MSITTIPLFDKLKQLGSKNILIAGCGGGFDIFCGLPLYFALKKDYCLVLANYSFVTDFTNCEKITSYCYKVNAQTPVTINNETYFPEKYLSNWFKEVENIDEPVYCFLKTGVKNIRNSYRCLVEKHNIDTIILVDGGTDVLMRGDEEGLGTPVEDLSSLIAINSLSKPLNKFLVCVGFGIDSFHGVNHYLFLENVANIIKNNGFLGTISILKDTIEYKKYKDCITYVTSIKNNTSIVNQSICDAVDGNFGDFHSTEKTKGSKLSINSLMSLYWIFDLDTVADMCKCKEKLINTNTYGEVTAVIWNNYDELKEKNLLRLGQPLPF